MNLRCAWAIGCPNELEPGRYFRERPDDPVHPTAVQYPDRFMELFPDEELPELVGVPCCSQFAVSREAVRTRSKEDYIRYRQWLLDTDLDNATSGRIFEYAWHSMYISIKNHRFLGYPRYYPGINSILVAVMFGKDAQHCPDEVTCYCEVYGMCDMSPVEVQNHWVWKGMDITGPPDPEDQNP